MNTVSLSTRTLLAPVMGGLFVLTGAAATAGPLNVAAEIISPSVISGFRSAVTKTSAENPVPASTAIARLISGQRGTANVRDESRMDKPPVAPDEVLDASTAVARLISGPGGDKS